MQEKTYRIVGPEVDIPFESSLDEVLALAANLRKKSRTIFNAPSSSTISVAVQSAERPVREPEWVQLFNTESLDATEEAADLVTNEREELQAKIVEACRNRIRNYYLDKPFAVAYLTKKLTAP